MEFLTHFYTIPSPSDLHEYFSKDLCMFAFKSLFSPKLPLDFPSGQCIIAFISVVAVSVWSSFRKFMLLYISLTIFTNLYSDKFWKPDPFLHSCILSWWTCIRGFYRLSILALFTDFYIYSPFPLYLFPLLSTVCSLHLERLWCLAISCIIQSLKDKAMTSAHFKVLWES